MANHSPHHNTEHDEWHSRRWRHQHGSQHTGRERREDDQSGSTFLSCGRETRASHQDYGEGGSVMPGREQVEEGGSATSSNITSRGASRSYDRKAPGGGRGRGTGPARASEASIRT